MRIVILLTVAALLTSTGCINRRYPPGVAVDPSTALKPITHEDMAAVNRDIANARSTPTN